MTKPTKVQVMQDKGEKIELKGQEFDVRFDLNALCELQDKFGDLELAFDGLDKGDFKKIRSLLHIALANGEKENITEKEVGALIDFTNLNVITEALTTAFSNAMPTASEEGK